MVLLVGTPPEWALTGITTRSSGLGPCPKSDKLNAGGPLRKKRICPSRARRNARRLQAFLDRKQALPLEDHASPDAVSQECSTVS